jgi:hypothetical protein
MEKIIKISILIIASSSTTLFLYADYGIWERFFSSDLFSDEKRHLITSIFTFSASCFSIPAIRFWFQLLVFNEAVIFRAPANRGSTIFLKQYTNQSRIALIYSIVLLLAVVSILLSALLFNIGVTVISFLSCFLFLIPFILIVIVSVKTFISIKSM